MSSVVPKAMSFWKNEVIIFFKSCIAYDRIDQLVEKWKIYCLSKMHHHVGGGGGGDIQQRRENTLF